MHYIEAALESGSWRDRTPKTDAILDWRKNLSLFLRTGFFVVKPTKKTEGVRPRSF